MSLLQMPILSIHAQMSLEYFGSMLESFGMISLDLHDHRSQ